MHVVCIFPVAYSSNKIPNILVHFKKEIGPKLTKLGATQIDIKFAGTDYTFVPINQTLQGEPKGKGVLQTLNNLPKQPDFVICCDGSGKIPYNYIVDIFQQLASDTSMHCVMANRVGNKAIIKPRYLIERFEIFSILRYHNHDENIPDGQCGLWGYKYGKVFCNGKFCDVTLSAEGYEIEIDLLSEVISQKLSYSFIDVNLPPLEIKTSFTYDNNLKKMEFLFVKYPSLKRKIMKYTGQFESTDEAKELLKDGKTFGYWKRYKEDLKSMIT